MIRTRKRGKTYHADYLAGSCRLRGSLGTQDKTVASRLKAKLEISMAEGAKSAGWVDLGRVLPRETYHRFSSYVGLANQTAVTWDALLSIFWKDCERRRLAKGTVARYQTTVDRFTEFLETKKVQNLTDISKSLVAEFRDLRVAQIAGNSRSRNGGGLYQDMSALRYIQGIAIENGLLTSYTVQKELRPEMVRGTKPFSGEELARMREVCSPLELFIFRVFRHTGMRGSDVADLKWRDVHFLDGEIRRKAIKNDSELQIPIGEELMCSLVESQNQQKADDFVIKIENKSTTRVQLYNLMRLMFKRANIQEAHPHRFRATFAVDLLIKGATTYQVAQLLGDREKTVEKHYLSFVPQVRDKVRTLILDNTKGLEA